MACPLTVAAQNQLTADNAEGVVRKAVVHTKMKKYDTRTVKGTVIDAATGAPLSGAIVKAAGVEGYSALTDDNGNYEVKVPLFSSALEVTTPDYNKVKMGLTADEQQKTVKLLSVKFGADYSDDENILGTKTADEFSLTNAINIKEEVQKQLGAYAYTTQRNGTPGVGSTMFIQGLNSLNVNAQPLVVVDGVILDQQYGRQLLHSGFTNDVLSNINPADIADVQIMRNGTALYGARGANGVVIINTRRSHSMATRITASASAGFNFEPKYYEMMGPEQYRGYASELLKGVNSIRNDFKFLNADPNYYYYNQYHNNTDWKSYIYDNSFNQNYGINVEGGDDVAKYNLSVGYTTGESTMKYNYMDRLNIRFNTDIVLTDKLDVRFDASFANSTRNLRDDSAPSQYDEGTPTAPSFLAYVKSPFISPYSYGNRQLSTTFLDITDETYLDEALAYYSNYNYKLGNPVAFNEYADAENKNRFETSMLNLSVTPVFHLNKHLKIAEHFTYNLINTSNKYYIPVNGVPTYYVSSVYANRENQVSSLASKQNSVESDTRIDWHNRFNAHDVALFGGVRINFENFTTSSQLGYNTGSDKTPFMSSGLLNAQSDGVDQSWRNMDMYLQGNYNYLGRYFAQLNLTASGSSRFGKDADGGLKLFGVKWGIFPGIQGSWVISNEPWFPAAAGIDYLRVSAGYDISGNDDVDPFASRSYFASSMYLGSLGISGLSFKGIGNNKIKWETTRRFNAGIEANLVNNRISVGINYFNSTTDDLLSLRTLSFLSGIDTNWTNAGSMTNTGFDASLRGKAIATKDWTLELGATVGHYHNTVKSIAGENGKTGYTTDAYNATILTQEGCAANLFYGYRTKGVYATTAQAQAEGKYVLAPNGVDHLNFEAGDMIFDDIDGNKEINENDRVVIGDPNPDIYGNIFAALTWKSFRLDVNFNYCLGNDVYNYMRSQLEGGSRFLNQTTALTQRWQAEGQITDVPRATFQDPLGNSRFSDRWIEDGSYLKLKTVTLSYDLPIKSTFLQGLRFWIQGNNLLTLTKYLGTDPEFSVTGSVIGQGIDFGSVAQSRSVVAGIKINL